MHISHILGLGSIYNMFCSAYIIPNHFLAGGYRFYKTPKSYKIEEYGIPNEENLVYFNKYISSINTDKKIPNWVLQYNNQINLVNKSTSKRPNFINLFNDNWVPGKSSYGKYSRGHLVPAGDYELQDKKDTFYLEANIVPQEVQHNQGIWNLLESRVRNNIIKYYDEAWILTGPIFLPYKYGGNKYIKYEIIGDSQIAVPNYLFKAILYKNIDTLDLDCYLIPNKYIKINDLDYYKLSLIDLENKFKYPIFPLIDKEKINMLS